MVIGHECSGQIVAVGDGVTNVAVGDRVALEPGVPCRACNYCKIGRYKYNPFIHFVIYGSLINDGGRFLLVW
jgi:L-iditol 2-dehydrogenase